jgi:hypothetical protein
VILGLGLERPPLFTSRRSRSRPRKPPEAREVFLPGHCNHAHKLWPSNGRMEKGSVRDPEQQHRALLENA